MYSVIALPAILLASSCLAAPNAVLERAACTTNSCLSALATRTATARPDCSSYLATTVTPCAKTVKTTITLTSTLGCSFSGANTAVAGPSTSSVCPVSTTASNIPAYASGICPDGAAYASACGCINARAIKTTLPASTVTATVYKTVKANPTFYVKQVSGGYNAGDYVSTGGDPEYAPEGNLRLYNDASTIQYWTLGPNNTVVAINGTSAWTGGAGNCQGCYYPVSVLTPSADDVPMRCNLGTLTNGYLPFTCKNADGGYMFENCYPDGDSLDMGGPPIKEFYDCFVAKLGAYPVCS